MSQPSIDDQEMPLIAHLTELRKRLLRCVVAIGLLFGGLFYFSQQIYALVAAPLRAYLPEGATMIATGVASPFLTPFKLTLMVALFLSMPIILYQIWGFIAQACTSTKNASPCRCWCRAFSCSTPAWPSPISSCSRSCSASSPA